MSFMAQVNKKIDKPSRGHFNEPPAREVSYILAMFDQVSAYL